MTDPRFGDLWEASYMHYIRGLISFCITRDYHND